MSKLSSWPVYYLRLTLALDYLKESSCHASNVDPLLPVSTVPIVPTLYGGQARDVWFHARLFPLFVANGQE